jgi:alpha-1,6-mannosyltransferase
VLILAGGLFTSALPNSSFASFPVLDMVRSSLIGRMAGLVVVVGGIALLSYAWLNLLPWCREPRFGVLRSRVAIAIWSIPLLAAPPLFSRDGWSYVAQGYLAREGLSPYIYPPQILPGPLSEAVDPQWAGTPAPYGPVPLIWGGLTSHLTFDPWLLLIADRVFALAGIAMLAWAIPKLARYAGSDAGLATWLVLPTPLMIAHGVGGLHNDIVMAGLMAVALVFAIERSWFLGAVVAGLAAAVKAPGGLIAIGVVLLSLGVRATVRARLVRTLEVALVAVATLVGVGFATGLGIGWLHALSVPASNLTPFSISTDLGLLFGSIATIFGPHSALATTVTVTRVIGVLGALGVGTWALLTRPPGVRPAAIAAVAWTLAAFTVLSPVVHPWYFFWALPLLSVIRSGPRVRNSLVAVNLILAVSAPLNSSLSGLYMPIVVTATLVVAVGLALLGRVWALPEDALGDPQPVRPTGSVD